VHPKTAKEEEELKKTGCQFLFKTKSERNALYEDDLLPEKNLQIGGFRSATRYWTSEHQRCCI
jgi:hypothetical protein